MVPVKPTHSRALVEACRGDRPWSLRLPSRSVLLSGCLTSPCVTSGLGPRQTRTSHALCTFCICLPALEGCPPRTKSCGYSPLMLTASHPPETPEQGPWVPLNSHGTLLRADPTSRRAQLDLRSSDTLAEEGKGDGDVTTTANSVHQSARAWEPSPPRADPSALGTAQSCRVPALWMLHPCWCGRKSQAGMF